MAFNQFKLDVATEQARGIFNTYVYESDTDTVADLQVAGYFDKSRFSSDPDWFGSLITAKMSDGSLTGFIQEDGSTTPDQIGNLTPVLFGESLDDQIPTGIDATTKMSFGPAQGDGSSPIQLLADGTVIFNQAANNLHINVVISFGRSGGVGESIIFFRTSAGGFKSKPIVKIIDNDKSQEITFISFQTAVPEGFQLFFEFVRDPAGDDSGSLLTATPTATDWDDIAPSATINIVQLK